MSKELEALKRFKDNIRWLEENTLLKHYFENSDLHLKEDLDVIKNAINQLEEQEKVLSIIKEKGVKELSVIEDLCNWDWNEYVKLPCSKLYTKEEFEILKEALLGKYLSSCGLPLTNEYEQIDEVLFWKAENNPKLGIDYKEYEGKYLGAVQNGPIDENFPVEWVIEKEDKTYFASPKMIGSRMIEMSPEDFEHFIGPRVKVKYTKKIN